MRNSLAIVAAFLFAVGCGTTTQQTRPTSLSRATTPAQAVDAAHAHPGAAAPTTSSASGHACPCMAGESHAQSRQAGEQPNGKAHDNHAPAASTERTSPAKHGCACMTGAGHGQSHQGK
jgi:hypothetical protein